MTTQSASSGWWVRFTFDGITRYERGTYDLVGGEELSDAERDELLQLCRQRLKPSDSSAARRCWAAMVCWVVSTPEIALNRGAGPGGDSAFQLQA
jgi:hypothetical protein